VEQGSFAQEGAGWKNSFCYGEVKALLRRENGGRRPYARGAGHEKARRKTG
jgi:hypothetical protein